MTTQHTAETIRQHGVVFYYKDVHIRLQTRLHIRAPLILDV
jgi:hypothetical protein